MSAPISRRGFLAAGALLGNQVGQGAGRTAATAAGAIGGSMIGDRIMSGAAQPPAPAMQPQGQAPMYAQAGQAPMQAAPCRVVDGVTREAIRGYSVVYRYAGRDITTTMPYHPGQSVRVAIGAADSVVAQPASAAYGAPPAPAYAPPAPPGYAPAAAGYAPPPPGYAPYAGPGQPPPAGGGYMQR